MKHILKSALVPALFLSSLTNAWAAQPEGTEIATQLLQSGKINLTSDTITVPLRHGKLKDGRTVWFVLLDASDETQANSQGLVYAPALASAEGTTGVRSATVDAKGEWTFDRGTVDFSPNRALTPGDAPNLFPPKSATPGSVGDSDYSPYAELNGVIYNAPIVAFNVNADQIEFSDSATPVNHSLVHDKVVSISPKAGLVTLALSHGFANGQPLIYVSLDANNPTAATMEGATYAPALDALKAVGATLPLYAVVNGETGANNPERQGFDSALSGEGSPLNVLTGIPTLSQLPYSPLWDLHIAEWTDSAIAAGKRTILKDARTFNADAQSGLLIGLGGAGLPSSGLLVNCPAVAILK